MKRGNWNRDTKDIERDLMRNRKGNRVKVPVRGISNSGNDGRNNFSMFP